MPRSLRAHPSWDIPARACPACTTPPPCRRTACFPEHSPGVMRSDCTSHSCAVWGASLLLVQPLSAHLQEWLNRLVICSLLQEGSPFPSVPSMEGDIWNRAVSCWGGAQRPLYPAVLSSAPRRGPRQLNANECPAASLRASDIPSASLVLQPPPTLCALLVGSVEGLWAQAVCWPQPPPGPCVLWKGSSTFVRQRILFTPSCE